MNVSTQKKLSRILAWPVFIAIIAFAWTVACLCIYIAYLSLMLLFN